MPGIGRGSDFAGAVTEKSKHSKGTLSHGTCDLRTSIYYIIIITYISYQLVIFSNIQYIYVYLSIYNYDDPYLIVQSYSYTSYIDKYRPPLSLGLALYKGFREKLKNSILFYFRQAARTLTKRLRSNCMSPWLSRWNFATCQGRLVTCGTKMWPTRPVTVAEWNFVGADLPIESLR